MPLVSIRDLNGNPDEVTKRVVQAQKLSALYDDFLTYEEPNGTERAPGIHASELYPCLRKPVYSLMGVPRKPRVSKFWKQRFKMGHAIHDFVQGDFERMAALSRKTALHAATQLAEEMHCYLEFTREVAVSPQLQEIARYYQIYSHCDGVFSFFDKETRECMLRVGLEIKSEAPDGYEKLKEPKPEHVRQAHIYMAALDLPLMWFFYMNKANQNNTNSKYPYLVIFQTAIWNEIEERCKEVHLHIVNNKMPDRTEGIWCEFCPWSYDCKPHPMMVLAQKREQGNPYRL